MLSSPLSNQAAWIAHWQSLDLPVLQYTLEQMRGLRSKADELGLRDLAALIEHDALLTLRVIRFLQDHRHASQLTDVSTVERVLLMIGIDGFFKEFSRAESLETRLADYPSAREGLRRVMARHYLAGRLATALGDQRHDVDSTEVKTASMLSGLAEMLLWLSAPQLATQIMRMQLQQPGLRSRDAQIAVIGLPLLELQLELASRWHLPELLTHLMDEKRADEARVRTVSVASALARHLGSGWNNPALPDDYQAVADLLGCDLDHAYQLVLRTALAAGRQWHWYQCQPPIALRALILSMPDAAPSTQWATSPAEMPDK
ncbi:HD-like signal output (HDOD) domain, no enzymatic activity [Andreprevotia lacus DSM 23236]|jgi:hypothetical protein|uniref:HD-like signal output (HDOD) domain, no enzymatic activity n=1 Tax=Andreprevotia lacus DSM 23236 TaxID=1121001 RepID=A0A1W1WW26_9NEIS|nr:HDOD domain-containing protein [Andreprevotia lacus]SMC15865.1 HD-like signal output (HDOD) domain, no enzymatic activity [Andreprevotia lacus DSM 23236]